jgi:type II secretory pathway component GspD/PulD (secretin)
MNAPSRLLAACGLALALASVLSLPAATMAQDKPAETPKKDDPEAAAREEFLKKIKAEAEKMGIQTNGGPPQPAAQPTPAPTPAPAPAAVKPTTPAVAPQQPSGGKPGVKPGMPSDKPGATPGSKPAQPAGVTAKPPTPGQPPKQPGVPNMPPPGGAGTAAGDMSAMDAVRRAMDPNGGDDLNLNVVDNVEVIPLVQYIMNDLLHLQMMFMDGGLRGQTIYLSGPITVKHDQLLRFATTLLEQKEYTMSQDSSGIFVIGPKNGTTPSLYASAWSSTRLIHTPNIKPSSLQTSVQALLTAGRGGQGGTQPVYMDDLGVILMTDSPRITGLIEEFVQRLVSERAALKFYRFDLVNISAAAAKDRVLELLGQQAQRISTGAGPGGAAVAAPPGAGGAGGQTITNLSERMTVDPTSNALYLRGRDDEQSLLRDMLVVIDAPNAMVSKWYPVGNKTSQAVAAAGKAEQLGSVTEFDFADSGGGGRSGALGGGAARGAGGAGGQNDTSGAGTGFVLYPEAGGFIYRGTEPQHTRVDALVRSLSMISADEKPTIEFYKLHHGKSTDVADTIQNLISNSAGSGNRSGGLLGRDLGGSRNRSTTPRSPAGANAARPTPNGAADGSGGASGGFGDLEGADVFVLADEPNNQVLVKAPAQLQPQFRQLIAKIDLRRPQVYIDAKIVVVSQSDSSRLAIEAQQIIGQFAFNTNFGLGTLGSSTTTGGTTTTSSGNLFDPKNVLTNLSGFTSALVRSKDVPFIINAIANNIDTRIVATPQLLVDDNEEAEISSLDQQPTGTTSQSSSAGSTVTGFQSYESAGPKLKVKPQISEGGYMRLEYSIELSSFSGSGSGNLPPPKLENKIDSKAVTIPTDSTIIVGGLSFTQTGNTVIKIPLLGDIPLVGNLFKDQSKSSRLSTLFVFISPRIMRDPAFGDLRLLSKGPLAESGLVADFPAPTTEAIAVVDTARSEAERKLKEEADSHKPPEPKSPEKGTPVRREKSKSDEPN